MRKVYSRIFKIPISTKIPGTESGSICIACKRITCIDYAKPFLYCHFKNVREEEFFYCLNAKAVLLLFKYGQAYKHFGTKVT